MHCLVCQVIKTNLIIRRRPTCRILHISLTSFNRSSNNRISKINLIKCKISRFHLVLSSIKHLGWIFIANNLVRIKGQ